MQNQLKQITLKMERDREESQSEIQRLVKLTENGVKPSLMKDITNFEFLSERNKELEEVIANLSERHFGEKHLINLGELY